MLFRIVKHINTFLEENCSRSMRLPNSYAALVGVEGLSIGLAALFNPFSQLRIVSLAFVTRIVVPFLSHILMVLLEPNACRYYLNLHVPERHNTLPLFRVTLYSVINLAITRFNMRFFVLLNAGSFVLRHALVLYTNTLQRVHSYCLQKVESRYNIGRTSVLRLMLNLIFYAMSLLVFVLSFFQVIPVIWMRRYIQSSLNTEEPLLV